MGDLRKTLDKALMRPLGRSASADPNLTQAHHSKQTKDKSR